MFALISSATEQLQFTASCIASKSIPKYLGNYFANRISNDSIKRWWQSTTLPTLLKAEAQMFYTRKVREIPGIGFITFSFSEAVYVEFVYVQLDF